MTFRYLRPFWLLLWLAPGIGFGAEPQCDSESTPELDTVASILGTLGVTGSARIVSAVATNSDGSQVTRAYHPLAPEYQQLPQRDLFSSRILWLRWRGGTRLYSLPDESGNGVVFVAIRKKDIVAATTVSAVDIHSGTVDATLTLPATSRAPSISVLFCAIEVDSSDFPAIPRHPPPRNRR